MFLLSASSLNCSRTVDLEQEELYAEKLVKNGLSFRMSGAGDGQAFKVGCGIVTSHRYISSDGEEISHPRTSCIERSDAESCYEKSVSELKMVLKNESVLDKHQNIIGKRAIGVNSDGKYSITVLRDAGCPSIVSSSLAHALAYEKWLYRSR